MANSQYTTQYIGARYVPIFYENSDGTAEWRAGVIYEPLTIVTYNNNSYTSRKGVPANIGNPSSNPDYWAPTGMYNQQVSDLSSEVADLSDRVDTIAGIVGNVYQPVNIMTLGAKNDGSEDVSGIINQYTESFPLYFPVGVYRLDNTVTLKNAIIGAYAADNDTACTVFESQITAGAIFQVLDADNTEIIIQHIRIMGNSHPVTAIDFKSVSRGYLTVDDVRIYEVWKGIYINPLASRSRCAHINNVYIWGASNWDSINDSIGIDVGFYAPDSVLENIYVLECSTGVKINGGNTKLLNTHLYPPNRYVTDPNTKLTYFGETMGVNAYTNWSGDNIYIDSCLQAIVQRNGTANIGNFIYWDDGAFVSTGRTDAQILSTRNENTGSYDGPGCINISNLIAGGIPTTIKKLASYNPPSLINIGNAKILFYSSYYTDAMDRFGHVPLIGYSSTNQFTKIYYAAQPGYNEIARIYFNVGGIMRISISGGSGITILDCRRSGSNITVTKVSETFTLNFWYRVVDNILIIYTNTPSSATVRFTVTMMTAPLEYAGLADCTGCKNFVYDHVDDVTLLTPIS